MISQKLFKFNENQNFRNKTNSCSNIKIKQTKKANLINAWIYAFRKDRGSFYIII